MSVPLDSGALFDPGGVEIGGGLGGFAEDDGPGFAGVDGFGDAVVEVLGTICLT